MMHLEKSTQADEAVGYGKPLKANQFKKGQSSANPQGRRGAKRQEPDDAVERVLARKVSLKVDGRKQTMSMDEAIVSRLATLAVNGDVPAAKELERRRRSKPLLAAPASAEAHAKMEKEHLDECVSALLIVQGLQTSGFVVEEQAHTYKIRYDVLIKLDVVLEDNPKDETLWHLRSLISGLPPEPAPKSLFSIDRGRDER